MRIVLASLVVTGCFIEPKRPLDRTGDAGPSGDGLVGSGDAAGSGSANIMFVTSTPFPINMTRTTDQRLMDADAACQTAAFQAPLASPVRGHYYKAWISTDLVNAADRMSMTGARVWIRVDGAPIAKTVPDLVDGALANPPLFDENGDMVGTSVRAMTGTDQNGLNSISNLGCGNGHIEIGIPTAMDGTWTDTGYDYCTTTTLRLYCLGYDVIGQL